MKASIDGYSERYPGSPVIGEALYALGMKMYDARAADLHSAPGIFRQALPLLKDETKRAEAFLRLTHYEQRHGDPGKALQLCLDFVETFHTVEGDGLERNFLDLLYLSRIHKLLLSAERSDDAKAILDDVRRRVAFPEEPLRVPYGLVNAIVLAQIGDPNAGRELIANEIKPTATLWKIRATLLEAYCALRAGEIADGTALVEGYLASPDDDKWILESLFLLAVMLHNAHQPKESLLVWDLLDGSALLQDPERKKHLSPDRIANFYQSYAIAKAANGDREGRMELERRTFEEFPDTVKGRHAGSWYAVKLNQQGREEEAKAICERILEVDDLSDAARKATLVLSLIDFKHGNNDRAVERLERKRAQVPAGVDANYDNWLKNTAAFMKMEAERAETSELQKRAEASQRQGRQRSGKVETAPPAELAIVVGRVTETRSGGAVEGIPVTINGREYAKTDADGNYRIEGAPVGTSRVGTRNKNEYLVPHRQGGVSGYYNYVQYSKVFLEPSKETRLDMQATFGGRISGRVVDESGQPVAKTYIWIVNQLDTNTIVAAQTGELGHYESFALLPNTLLEFLVWSGEGRGSCRRTAILEAGKTHELDFVLDTVNDYRIVGTIVDAEGRCIPDLRLRCSWRVDQRLRRWDTTTNDAGQYSFCALDPKTTYTVYVEGQSSGYKNVHQIVPFKESEHQEIADFTLSQPASSPSSAATESKTSQDRANVQLPTKKFGTLELSWPLVDNFRIARKFKPSGADASHGIDLEAREGSPIYAAADGDVLLVGTPSDDLGSSFGNYVVIYHGKVDGKGVRTLYTQNKENLVEKGQKVKRGDLIARVGKSGQVPSSASGSFVHFELRQTETALNPLEYLVERQ